MSLLLDLSLCVSMSLWRHRDIEAKIEEERHRDIETQRFKEGHRGSRKEARS